MTGRLRDDWVAMGRISKPHGVRGELKVIPYSEAPAALAAYRKLYIAADDRESMRAWTCQRVREQGRRLIVQLRECCNRTQAESRVGMELWIPKAALPPLEEDEFYLHDLIGREVVLTRGPAVGKIKGFLERRGQEVLVVAGRGHEHLIPLHRDFIVSLERKRLIMDLPDGLLDINR